MTTVAPTPCGIPDYVVSQYHIAPLRTARDQHDWQTFSVRQVAAIPVVAPKRRTASRSLRASTRRKPSRRLPTSPKKGTPGARVSAAIALLDRAYGKPPQFNTSDAASFNVPLT